MQVHFLEHPPSTGKILGSTARIEKTNKPKQQARMETSHLMHIFIFTIKMHLKCLCKCTSFICRMMIFLGSRALERTLTGYQGLISRQSPKLAVNKRGAVCRLSVCPRTGTVKLQLNQRTVIPHSSLGPEGISSQATHTERGSGLRMVRREGPLCRPGWPASNSEIPLLQPPERSKAEIPFRCFSHRGQRRELQSFRNCTDQETENHRLLFFLFQVCMCVQLGGFGLVWFPCKCQHACAHARGSLRLESGITQSSSRQGPLSQTQSSPIRLAFPARLL